MNDEQIKNLRTIGILNENEIAETQGDLVVATNVLTNERRIVGQVSEILTENTNRRILKG